MAYMLDIVIDTNIRVGNKKYMTANNSFGLTTLMKEHLSWNKGNAILKFRGKHGVIQNIEISNKQIIQFLHTMESLPEKWLMKYKSHDGKWYRVSAQDLNSYFHGIVGEGYSIKDCRTWGANKVFVESILKLPLSGGIEKNISYALDACALKLGNTKATSKKSYVMDYVMDEYRKNPKKFIDNSIFIDLI